LKLNSLIKRLQKKYKGDLNLSLINANNTPLKVASNINLKDLSNLRLKFDRLEFLKIKKKIIEKTKHTLLTLYRNLIKLRIYNYKGIFFPKLFEFDLSLFLNEVFGNYEVLKQILYKEKYDKIILFNYNRYILDFFKVLNSSSNNLLLFKDYLFLKSSNILNFLSVSKYIFLVFGIYIKQLLLRNNFRNNVRNKNKRKKIIFYANTENQFISTKPIYDFLKKDPRLNPIFYSSQTYLNLKNLIEMFRYTLWTKNLLLNHKEEISRNLYYNSVNLENVLKIFYFNVFSIDLIRLFNILNNFINFIRKIPPKLVIITNDFLPSMRMIAKYSKLKNIHTLYIPHAAIPIIDEMVTKNDIEYFALGGEIDKKYYIIKGIPPEKIKVTGVPRYEYFFKNPKHNLDEIKDIFDGRRYKIDKDKFTVLLTTNPIDDESNEKIISSVINSLKDFKLENNLIIKLHPRENGRIHRTVLKKLKVEPIITKNYKILDIIASCDLLFSQKSTTILEAMLVGTPIIVLDFINKGFKETSRYMFLDEKFVNVVKNEEELNKRIQELFSNDHLKEEYHKKLTENARLFSFYDPQKPPIERIASFILKLIE
ncbi:MAG: hypothetical protein ACFFA6_04285, partial [Promethearchaeota archaeon]